MSPTIQVISRDTIKPSSPTPPHLRTYHLSWLDQLSRLYHLPIVFFYSSSTTTTTTTTTFISLLKASLSLALTRFYPLAGRLVANSHVSCDDSGADFFQAASDSPISSFLRHSDLDQPKLLLPCSASCAASAAGPLLSVQATAFNCGGVAIGVCLSHKIVDGISAFAFLQSWATPKVDAPSPVFDGPALFPPSDKVNPEKVIWHNHNLVTVRKRFLLDGAKISAAKSTPGKSTTRVQVVAALLWRCALRSRAAADRPSVASVQVNTRHRMEPPAEDGSFGNRCILSGAAAGRGIMVNSEKLAGLLEEEIARSVGKVDSEFTRRLGEVEGYKEAYKLIVDGVVRSGGFEGFDHYVFTSWLRLPVYEVDFGWGRPAWVAVPCSPEKNLVLLMPRGEEEGVEAWVALEEEEMGRFEKDEEMISFLVKEG